MSQAVDGLDSEFKLAWKSFTAETYMSMQVQFYQYTKK